MVIEEPIDQMPAGAARILVIDDEREIYDLLHQELSADGFAILYAENGRKGLEMARQYKPELITLDIIMPDVDGWTVLQELKADPELAAIPVVVLTVMGDKQMAIALGAADFVTKPIDSGQLTALIQQHKGQAGRQVLIVDDEADSRNLLRRTLVKEGWSIAEARDGNEALSSLQRHNPSLVLLDLAMPGMDGFELLKKMRDDEKWTDIPVLIVSAKDPTQEERTLLSGNVHQILQKGQYDRETLVSDIKQLLESA